MTATMFPRRIDSVLEFYTGTSRSTMSMATSRIRVLIAADGTTIYDKTHDGWLTRVAVPIAGADKVTVDITNVDGGIYNILAYQLTLREAGVAGPSKSPMRKIVTLGDSWFANYSGQFAVSLAAKSASTVINHGVGGMTSEWGLAWFDEYVLKEKPDEVWIHFFTNDSNNLAGTFIAPDGSTKPLWPAGLTNTQAIARWRANIFLLIKRAREAGIKPVVIMPGGTASEGQTQKHAEWAANLDVPALLTPWSATVAELADPTAYVNLIGKKVGVTALVGSSTRSAQGPLPSDGWRNLAEDALASLQKKTFTLSSYSAVTGVVIGTDTNADGLSDGLSTSGWGPALGDTHTPSIVGGNQRYTSVYSATAGSGNVRVGLTFPAVAGKDYIAVFDVINAPASTTFGDSVSDISGSAKVFTQTGERGAATTDATGVGALWYRATANATGAKYARIQIGRIASTTRSFDIRRAFVLDVAALIADAPNMAGASDAELVAFALALKP